MTPHSEGGAGRGPKVSASREPYAILVVDDDPLINRMLERILRAWSHDVVTAFGA